MRQTNLDFIARAGAAARSRGEPFASNPHSRGAHRWNGVEDLRQWEARCMAWATGWVREAEQCESEARALVAEGCR